MTSMPHTFDGMLTGIINWLDGGLSSMAASTGELSWDKQKEARDKVNKRLTNDRVNKSKSIEETSIMTDFIKVKADPLMYNA